MTNGNDRDLDRLINTLAGFRAVHGHWPTRVRVSKGFIDSIRGILTKKGFQQLNSKVTLISRSTGIKAEDDYGLCFSYGDQVLERTKGADIDAWLGSLECLPNDDNDGMIFLDNLASPAANYVDDEE